MLGRIGKTKEFRRIVRGIYHRRNIIKIFKSIFNPLPHAKILGSGSNKSEQISRQSRITKFNSHIFKKFIKNLGPGHLSIPFFAPSFARGFGGQSKASKGRPTWKNKGAHITIAWKTNIIHVYFIEPLI